MSKSGPEETEINIEDIKHIMLDDFIHFPRIIDNCICFSCSESMTTVTKYKVYLNSHNDIILRGDCEKCGKPVSRYIETGENLEGEAQAYIQKIKKGKNL